MRGEESIAKEEQSEDHPKDAAREETQEAEKERSRTVCRTPQTPPVRRDPSLKKTHNLVEPHQRLKQNVHIRTYVDIFVDSVSGQGRVRNG